MPDSFSTASLRTAFTYPFQSRDGPGRFIIGAALLLFSLFIPLVPAVFVYGYLLRVMRHVIRGEEPALPEWRDWAGLGVDGLRGLVAAVIYLGPACVVMIGGLMLYLLLYVGGFSLIGQARHTAFSGLAVVIIVGAVGVLCLSMFAGWLLALCGGAPLPGALAHLADRERLAAAFNVFEWGAIVAADKWGYFFAWVITLGLAGIIYCAILLLYSTLILMCVAVFIAVPLGFYLCLVAAVVFAQAYRAGAARLHTPAPTPVPTPAGPASAEPVPAEPVAEANA